MSTWMSSDDDFFMIRRFEKLGARVILLMQYRIAKLEEELHVEDTQCARNDGDNGTFEGDPCKRRHEIMDELVWRLEHYRKPSLHAHVTCN